MTDQDKLLPCPHCGGEACRSMGQKADGYPWPYIECEDCAACTEVDVWNQRTDLCPPDAAARIAKLEEALRWYGDDNNYAHPVAGHYDGVPVFATQPVLVDHGQRARALLGEDK